MDKTSWTYSIITYKVRLHNLFFKVVNLIEVDCNAFLSRKSLCL